jgi:hypothetical protein
MTYLILGYAFATLLLGGFLAVSLLQLLFTLTGVERRHDRERPR